MAAILRSLLIDYHDISKVLLRTGTYERYCYLRLHCEEELAVTVEVAGMCILLRDFQISERRELLSAEPQP